MSATFATFSTAALAVSQSIELSILAKATVMLALGLTAARVAARAQASVRHLLLAVTFGTIIVLPLAVVAVPGVIVRVPAGEARQAIVPTAPAVVGPSSSAPPASAPADDMRSWMPPWWSTLPWPTMIRSAWLAGAAALLLSLGFAVWRIRRIHRTGLPRPDLQSLVQSLAHQAGIRRAIEVLEHEQVPAPLTCGVWRPAIVLPLDARRWTDAEVERALVHELEHVRRGDWTIQVAARAACACYWFHPLAWVAWRRLCLEAERACDDAVVRSAERTDYADQLVLLARRLSNAHAPAMLGMANRSDLSTRVMALLDESQRRGRAGIVAAASAIATAGLMVLTIAPVRAVSAVSDVTTLEPTEGATGFGRDGAGEQRSRRGGERRVRALDRALYEAAEGGDADEIDALLQAGANVNAVIDGDGSPLIGAAREGHLAAARHLLDRGADPNLAVPGDGNPLIMAAREGHRAVVTLLLDRGASIDLMVEDDENALIQASGEGHLEVVTLLVARGANVNARAWADSAYERPQGEWRTPLSMARKGGHASVVTFLRASGAVE